MDSRTEARALVQDLDQRMGQSAYDTAWMARLRDASTGDPRWPDLIEWLLENQHPNGSWGGEIEYYHDRIICTLAAIIALQENGHDHQAKAAVKHGESYLWHNIPLLSRDPFELSGFELVFPTLLAEAQELDLDIPSHPYGYGQVQAEKLRLIPPQLLYSPNISTVYSLEFLGQRGDPELLAQAVGDNGSVGNSPATTAYYSLLASDERALRYLRTVREKERMVTVYPFRTFELSWVLNNLSLSGLPMTKFVRQDQIDELRSRMTETGFTLDPTFGVTDGDITSVCCAVLLRAGSDVDPRVLGHFQDDEAGIFHTYEYERNVSVTTNVHALEALHLMADYPSRDKVREQIIVALLDNREQNTYWIDKWHASPYYPTAHALLALLREGPHIVYACRAAIDWMLHTQREDGSWGFFGRGTREETAYALTALLHYHRLESIDEDILHRGAAYLARHHQESEATYPELWLAKSIYAPCSIVESAVLAALILYNDTLGRAIA
jgi:halimadienyl-diphosphate synthase